LRRDAADLNELRIITVAQPNQIEQQLLIQTAHNRIVVRAMRILQRSRTKIAGTTAQQQESNGAYDPDTKWHASSFKIFSHFATEILEPQTDPPVRSESNSL
jgi:hypothetical protein